MGSKFVNVDLVRLSQEALPIAKKYNKDSDNSLNQTEYNNFLTEWNKKNSAKSPLLMQLHMKTLSDKAAKIAKICDGIDSYKDVLTEAELKKFMYLCEKNNINDIFKPGTTLKTVLTGKDEKFTYNGASYKAKPKSKISDLKVRLKLFENWLKLDVISYKGSDKYFHSVGNFEALKYGSENTIKDICKKQDLDKRNNAKRPENDYTEDLYANFLGITFGKMYPDENPHDTMSALAPKGFDIEKSKKSGIKLFYENAKDDSKFIIKKSKEYFGFLKESYIIKRYFLEIKDNFGF